MNVEQYCDMSISIGNKGCDNEYTSKYSPYSGCEKVDGINSSDLLKPCMLIFPLI